MIRFDEAKLAKLKTANRLFDEEYGLPGTPTREAFHAESMTWFYGELLRDRRKSLKMRQKQLDAKINVPRPYISHVERGKSDLQFSYFLRIASALGLQMNLTVQ
jgi:ribosome-binding protein aMBF1 (putative translation factor)